MLRRVIWDGFCSSTQGGVKRRGRDFAPGKAPPAPGGDDLGARGGYASDLHSLPPRAYLGIARQYRGRLLGGDLGLRRPQSAIWNMRESRARIATGLTLLLLWTLFLVSGVNPPPLSHAANQRPAPPRQINIGTAVYTIEMVEKVPPAGDASGLAGKACDQSAVRNGWCDAKDRIYLETRRPLQQERTTLLHEIQHVLLGTEKSEEQTKHHDFIYELSPKLLQVLQDNPELYLYLTAPGPNQDK